MFKVQLVWAKQNALTNQLPSSRSPRLKLLLFLPLVIPLTTAISSLFAWRYRRLQRFLSILGASALVAAAAVLLAQVRREGIMTVQAGSWPAPFGITLVADLFSAIMVLVAGVMGLVISIYALASTSIEHESLGYHPLFQVLLLGVCGSFLTGDLFNLYVWFEVMLIASFALLALGSHRGQMEGAVKYMTLNLVASGFLLAGVGIMYGVAGTLNMADLALQLRDTQQGGIFTVVAMLFFTAFGIKSAVFPLFFWLPASYHTPPVAVSAIFAGLLTKVGVYVLIRVFTLLFTQDTGFSHNLILWFSCLTMVTGVLGAAAQNEFRRILSFHIISQVGYMVVGLGIFTPLALAGSIFYIVHHIIVKTSLFLVSGLVFSISGTYELKKLGGFYQDRPGVSVLFLLPALSLAGIPPLSGFWAKLFILQAAIETESYIVVTTALAVALLTLFSMTKIWGEVFWKEQPTGEEILGLFQTLSGGSRFILLSSTTVLVILTVFLGIVAEPLFLLAQEAAAQLMNPEAYIAAVLENSR
jgi:multicomponent Na+:H+ antiporter subunit D